MIQTFTDEMMHVEMRLKRRLTDLQREVNECASRLENDLQQPLLPDDFVGEALKEILTDSNLTPRIIQQKTLEKSHINNQNYSKLDASMSKL